MSCWLERTRAGWWNLIPAYVFYTTIFLLLPAVGLIALFSLAASEFRKHSRR